jgi:hypothetical protein
MCMCFFYAQIAMTQTQMGCDFRETNHRRNEFFCVTYVSECIVTLLVIVNLTAAASHGLVTCT